MYRTLLSARRIEKLTELKLSTRTTTVQGAFCIQRRYCLSATHGNTMGLFKIIVQQNPMSPRDAGRRLNTAAFLDNEISQKVHFDGVGMFIAQQNLQRGELRWDTGCRCRNL